MFFSEGRLLRQLIGKVDTMLGALALVCNAAGVAFQLSLIVRLWGQR